MVSDRFANERFKAGYTEGYSDGYAAAMRNMRQGFIPGVQEIRPTDRELHEGTWDIPPGAFGRKRKKPKRKQSGKAKLLTQMTAPVWKKYKKGSGRKTYVQIRAQVSRSQAYKRKAKKL